MPRPKAPTPEERQAMAEQTAAEQKAKLEKEGTYVSPTRGIVEPPLQDEDPSQAEFLEEAAAIFADDLADVDELDLDGPVTISFTSSGILKTTKGLHTKLAEVMGAVGRIPKNGTAPAAMGAYKFVQVGDAADAIRKLLAERGISMLPESIEEIGIQTGGGTRGNTTTQTVRTTWRLTDGETGESATIQSMGTGQDNGDKYSPKAQTNAMKYALLMGFLLSTGDDPEAADLSEPIAGPGITITGSNITGVRQGGRQTKATQTQIDAIRAKARELDLTAESLAVLIATALGGKAPDIDALENANDRQRAVLDFIGTLTFDECGAVVQALEAVPPAA
jgi:hypothetical protein